MTAGFVTQVITGMPTRDETEYETWVAQLTVDNVRRRFRTLGCEQVIVKVMGANNNSKQQVWLANHLNEVAFLPFGPAQPQPGSSQKRSEPQAIFHFDLAFSWIGPDGASPAPHAKLIYYPQYPEVRFSGFLRGCRQAPAHLMRIEDRGKEEGRLLLLGVNATAGRVFGLVVGHDTPLASGVAAMRLEHRGVLRTWPLAGTVVKDPRALLLEELCSIAQRGWVESQRLTRSGLVPYLAENGGGYTIEALLGIVSNSNAAPDRHGHEVKQIGVGNLNRPRAKDVTLFDAVPDGGEFTRLGTAHFIRSFGHLNHSRHRYDFAGRHRVGHHPPRTGASLQVSGYDGDKMESNGTVNLIGSHGEELMSWSFAKLMDHWARKHALAAYIPSENRMHITVEGRIRQYRYGQTIGIGTGTAFTRFLDATRSGAIRYDPGMHAPEAADSGSSKVRSLFRIHSSDLHRLYEHYENVDACRAGSTGQLNAIGMTVSEPLIQPA